MHQKMITDQLPTELKAPTSEYIMTKINSLIPRARQMRRLQHASVSALALALFIQQATPAFATIDNTATATGTPASGTLPPVTPSTVNVPVAPATPTLTVAKSVAAPVDVNSDGVIGLNDTITYTYIVTNTGNVTINAARPLDAGPTFNTIAGTNVLGAFSPVSANLAPGAFQSFTAVYTLSALDAYRAAGIPIVGGNAVENSATATGTPATGTLGVVTPSIAETAIPANPRLSITKAWAFLAGPTGDVDGDGFADVGDRVVYTYTVTNAGNIRINGASISDVHEGSPVPTGAVLGTITNETLLSSGPFGVNSDAANNGSYDVLQPASVIRFTYQHLVTQAEVDGG